MRFTCYFVVILFFTSGLIFSCSRGGTILLVSDIRGPESMQEHTGTVFSVEASGDTGITYSWAVSPQGSGTFSDRNSPETEFYSGGLTPDTPFTIRVVVTSDNDGPVVRSKEINGSPASEDSPTGWVKTWGSHYSTGYDTSSGIFFRNMEEIYVCGNVWQNAGLDPESTAKPQQEDLDDQAFLSRYDSSGNFIWGRSWGGKESDMSYSVTADRFGTVYVCGSFYEESDFYPGPLEDIHTSLGSRDAYLTMYSLTGDYIKTLTWGSTEYESARIVEADEMGNVYVAGITYGICDFDPGPGQETRDIDHMIAYISRFDPQGNFDWVRTVNGPNYNRITDICVRDSDSIHIIGQFYDTIEYETGAGYGSAESSGSSDAFFMVYDAAGNLVDINTWGGPGHDTQWALAFDDDGNMFIAGEFSDTVDFDRGPGIETRISTGCEDAFLCKFDSSGALVRALTWGGKTTDRAVYMVIDDFGYIDVVGNFAGLVDLDPGPDVTELLSTGELDLSISRFDPDLNLQWVVQLDARGHEIAVDYSGSIYLEGGFYDIVDFMPGNGIQYEESMGSSDAFLFKMASDGCWW